MKKILIIANYFYPDVASLGQIITELSYELKKDFNVCVLAAIPNYSDKFKVDKANINKKFYIEKVNGITVYRIIVPNVDKKNKISRINYILKYYCNSKKAIRSITKYDIVLTVSQPPILGGMLGRYAKKIQASKLIYNIQDFNPEQIEAIDFSKSKLLISILKYFDNKTCSSADEIVLVGNDQLPTLKKRNYEFTKKANVINNWIDDQIIKPIDEHEMKIMDFKKRYKIIDKFVVMYSGNIGLFYDLENLIKVAYKLKDYRDIQFVFIGTGARKKDLEEYKLKNKLDNITFIPYQKKEDLNISLNSADVHLVVNAKKIKGVSVPSKLYGVMGVGKYIIGVLEKNSEARNIIEASQCGKCVETEDYNGFEKLIIDAYINRSSIKNVGLNGRKYLEKYLAKDKSIDKYIKLITKL